MRSRVFTDEMRRRRRRRILIGVASAVLLTLSLGAYGNSLRQQSEQPVIYIYDGGGDHSYNHPQTGCQYAISCEDGAGHLLSPSQITNGLTPPLLSPTNPLGG